MDGKKIKKLNNKNNNSNLILTSDPAEINKAIYPLHFYTSSTIQHIQYQQVLWFL